MAEILGWIADKVVTSLAVFRLRRDRVVLMGGEAIRLSWTAAPEMTQMFRSQTFPSLPIDFMPNIAKQMMQVVIEIATAPDPRMANRERLTNVVLELAPLEVLMLGPPPLPDVTGLRGKPGITGALKQWVPEIARKDKRLRDFFAPSGGVENLSPDDLRNRITIRYYILRGWAGMHQVLRMAWRDAAEEPLTDWYRPLVENMCAWEEHKMRKLLGMEPSLGGRGRDPEIEMLARATFMNIVMSGVPDPVGAWREHYTGWNL